MLFSLVLMADSNHLQRITRLLQLEKSLRFPVYTHGSLANPEALQVISKEGGPAVRTEEAVYLRVSPDVSN